MFIAHKSLNDGRVTNPSSYTATLHREASVWEVSTPSVTPDIKMNASHPTTKQIPPGQYLALLMPSSQLSVSLSVSLSLNSSLAAPYIPQHAPIWLVNQSEAPTEHAHTKSLYKYPKV